MGLAAMSCDEVDDDGPAVITAIRHDDCRLWPATDEVRNSCLVRDLSQGDQPQQQQIVEAARPVTPRVGT